MKLKSPVTREISSKAHDRAKENLKRNILRWMRDNGNTMLDTSNPVISYHLNSLMLSALDKARKDTRFEQRDWILTLSVPEEIMRSALQAYIAQSDQLATKFWNEALTFKKPETLPSFVGNGLKSLFYNLGCFGGCMNMPAEAAVKQTQEVINKLTLKADEIVISGKPGQKAKSAPVIHVMIDSIPFSGIQLVGKLPSDERVFALQTGPEGVVKLDDMNIPYVAKGTFLHIQPYYGAVIGIPIDFDAVDLGLQAGSNKEISMIFNITRPVYSLKYKVNAASDITIPEHFAGSAHLEQYLQDSCYMEKQSSDDIADLLIETLCQVSMYSSDETEEVYIKVEGKFIVHPIQEGTRIEKDVLIHSKAFEAGKDIPFGLFFWESATALKHKVKDLISSL
ncbi:MAG: hypothetical protein GF401_10300 [Chitinivibrionales bacterium]|nr:hypothetical protein [Chitinivibrionales bacterium]